MKDGLTQVKELKDKIHEQHFEIERLNNIINELEKYAGLGELNWEDKYQDIMLSGKGLLKRIKELKGKGLKEYGNIPDSIKFVDLTQKENKK